MRGGATWAEIRAAQQASDAEMRERAATEVASSEAEEFGGATQPSGAQSEGSRQSAVAAPELEVVINGKV